MIEIKNLTKSYDKEKNVLDGVSITVPDSSVFGLVGINGAGKSTLLRLIAGVLRKDGGQVCVDGEEVYENELVKQEIFFLPDDPFYTSNMTAFALADMYKSVYPFHEEVFLEYLEKFKLSGKTAIQNYSKGMKRQLFVALALAIAPKYLLLDEAFDGLDPLARMTFKKAIIRLVEERGTCVIISSHSLRELEDICDSYGILDQGKITCSGDLANDLTKLHKFQVAFENGIEKKDLPFACMSFSQTGKVTHLIAKGDAEELIEKLQSLQPLFVEEIEVDFEELFIAEVEARGYLQ